MIDTKELVKAGFLFIGHSYRVQFYFCAGGVGKREWGDVPIDENRKHFEKCDFFFKESIDETFQ